MQFNLLILKTACFIFLAPLTLFAQQQKTKLQLTAKWSKKAFEQNYFVENNGQVKGELENKNIKFTASNTGIDYYFSPTGLTFKHNKKVAIAKPETKKEESKKTWYKYVPEFLEMEWVGANPNAKIEAEQMQSGYHTFGFNDGKAITNIKANVFSKIIYRNVYPHIDVEYFFPEGKGGIKYNIILHPGADVSQIKIHYKNAEGLIVDENGNAVIKSAFGNFTEHAPHTFFEQSKKTIKSSFSVSGNQIAFNLSVKMVSEKIIIDPWVTNPPWAGYRAGYDVNFDNNGNVYVLGSSSNPFQEMKFDAAGNWIWTYNMVGSYYAYGDFAVDENSGLSFIAEGKTGPTLVHKVDANGFLMAQNASNDGELWRMVFNRVTGNMVIGNSASQAEIMTQNLNFTLVNVTMSSMNDNTLMTIDCASNDIYMAGNSGIMVKVPANTLTPVQWQTNTGYTFQYAGCRDVDNWTYPVMGFNGMAVSPNWLYTYDGNELKKWNKNNGALINSINITGNPFDQGGLEVDECDNVYVGGNNSVMVYDLNFNLLATYNLPNKVYDLKMGNNNLLYATGIDFLEEIQVVAPVATTLTLTQTPATCSACNGTATVTVNNTCVAISYLWSNGQTTQTATGLCTGTYTVTVTNACNRTFTDSITVTGNNVLTVNLTQNNVMCFGQNNGTGTATPVGGNGPYTYLWTPSGQTTQTATGLAPGTYTIVVTDANGCSSTQTITITQPPALNGVGSVTPSTCGNNNGSATVVASGGTPNYTYQWAPSGGTNATATGLAGGTYTLTITDANGCTANVVVLIQNSNGPQITVASQTNVQCNGGNNGSANINVTGGTSPYTYVWTPSNQTTQNATGLSAGTYTVTVTDANGCSQVQTVTITQPTTIAINTSATNTTCTGSTGTATATPSGGTPNYTYAWNNGQTTQTATGLAAGTYTVIVTDANGCTQTQTIVVISNNPVTLTASATPSACDVANGSATANPANGTSPYTYAWNNGQTTQTATGLAAGNYTVIVTDANGCSQTQTITVGNTPPPTASANASFTTIASGGTSQLTATGGVSYSWYPPTGLSCVTCQNPSSSPASTTTYCVQVTDANGCTATACVTINVDVDCGTQLLSTLLPNAFSPNNDGYNDKLCVPNNVCILNFVLKVYDRWGEKVFESTNTTNCWDGTYKGQLLNAAVFVYYFDATLSNGESFSQKGNISLIK